MRSGVIAGARRRTVTPVAAPFSDTFDTTVDTTNKWKGTTYGVSVVAGRLRVPTSTAFPQAQSAAAFDLTAAPIWVEVPTVPNAGAGGTATRLRIVSGANEASFYLQGSPLAWAFTITGQGNTFLTYNATNHRWLRFRVSAGNLLWETSPDNVTWTVQRTFAAPSWITTGLVSVILMSGAPGTETTPGNAEFDNFCV